jgi:hypothetical protein
MNKKPVNLAEIKILVVDDDEDIAHGWLLLAKKIAGETYFVGRLLTFDIIQWQIGRRRHVRTFSPSCNSRRAYRLRSPILAGFCCI